MLKKVFKRVFGFNHGRHASCSGHHYHVRTAGWRCCGCKHKVSARGAVPESTGECRQPDAIVAANRGARQELVLEQLGYRTDLKDEKTLPINLSRLRLRPDQNLQSRSTGTHART